MSGSFILPTSGHPAQAAAGIDEVGLRAIVARVLNRWPSAGLAVGVIRAGSLAMVPRARCRGYRIEEPDHEGHRFPDRLHHQDLHRPCSGAGDRARIGAAGPARTGAVTAGGSIA